MVKQSTKLYVGNLPESAQSTDLQVIFEKYGDVAECDVVKNYGFVHMTNEDEAKVAVESLNNSDFMGSRITVQISHSKVRQRPGMGEKGQCYRCGRQGHWSKECPRNPDNRMGSGSMMGPSGGYMSRFDRGMDRYPADRGYGLDRGYAAERMRPYPDPYERRIPPAPASRDEYYSYYRRAYDDYPYARQSPPRFLNSTSYDRRYDFQDDRAWSRRSNDAVPSSGMQN